MKLTDAQQKGFLNVQPTSKDVVIAQLRDAEFRLKLHQLKHFNKGARTSCWR